MVVVVIAAMMTDDDVSTQGGVARGVWREGGLANLFGLGGAGGDLEAELAVGREAVAEGRGGQEGV